MAHYCWENESHLCIYVYNIGMLVDAWQYFNFFYISICFILIDLFDLKLCSLSISTNRLDDEYSRGLL